jgi:tetratricopeptide (TPR) repeat protein/transcriptional regulator with XRE-family HTH domain
VDPARELAAQALRAARLRAGLTQEQLATRAQLSVRTIRYVERGRVRHPHRDTAERLARALGLSGAAAEEFLAVLTWPEQLTDAEPAAPEPAPLALVPAQLPLDIRGFVARDDELSTLESMLADAEDGSTPVVLLSGMAGVGKTALAVHWAHRVADRFPGGQVYLDLRGFDPAAAPVSPAEAVRLLLDAFGVAPDRVPAGLAAQAALYRTEIAGRRVLLVLDNAHDAEQVRPLLPGTPGCMVVVTSRLRLTGLVVAAGAEPLGVDLLSATEAAELFTARIGSGRAKDAEGAVVDEIVELCARLPLALSIAAARAVLRPEVSLAILAAELRAARNRLAVLSVPDPNVDLRSVLSWSYRELSAPAAALLRLLGLHPGPDFDAPAVASLAGVPLPDARSALDELAEAHLVNEHVPGRYLLHDLLRQYSAELADSHDDAAGRNSARERMFDHYLHAAHRAVVRLDPARIPIELPAARAGVCDAVPDPVAPAGWFAAELRVLRAVTDAAVVNGFDGHAWRIAWTLSTYYLRNCLWCDQAAVQTLALAAARRLGDPEGEASALRSLALARAYLGEYDEAGRHLADSLRLFDKLGDRRAGARTHLTIAGVLERQGRQREALANAEAALELYQRCGDLTGQGNALNAVGWYHTALGDHELALTYCRRGLALLRKGDDLYGQAAALHSIGHAHHTLGNYRSAAGHHRSAIRLYRRIGERYYEADSLTSLAEALHAGGRFEAAHDARREALALLGLLGHPDTDPVHQRLIALSTMEAIGPRR